MARAKTKAPARGEVVSTRPLLFCDSEAAAALGRSPSWIRGARAADVRAIRQGKRPTGPTWITIAKSVFYRLSDLEEWVSANAVERGVVPFSNRGTATPNGPGSTR